MRKSQAGRGARLRHALLEAVRGVEPPVTDGLEAFASWLPLSVLWETGWLGGNRRSDHVAAVEARARFREIVAARRAVAALAQAKPGEVVCVCGEVRMARMIESGAVSIDDGSADPVLVHTAGAQVIGRRYLRTGDRVTLLGFCDRIIDPSVSSGARRQPPWRLVVRSSDSLPLVVVIR